MPDGKKPRGWRSAKFQRQQPNLMGCIPSIHKAGFTTQCFSLKCEKTCKRVNWKCRRHRRKCKWERSKTKCARMRKGKCVRFKRVKVCGERYCASWRKRRKCTPVLLANGKRKCGCRGDPKFTPLGKDMQTLWHTAQNDFCPHAKATGKKCDASLCYKYPYHINRWTGKPHKGRDYYLLGNRKVVMTVPNGGKDPVEFTVYFNLKVTLEKVIFCEIFNPPIVLKTNPPTTQSRSCRAVKNCQMKGVTGPGRVSSKLVALKCARSAHSVMTRKEITALGFKPGLQKENCPKAEEKTLAANFMKQFKTKINDLVELICAKI